MSKYDVGQLNFAALCIDGKKIAADHGGLVAELDGTVVADMLREYAAHLARQSEGVSDEQWKVVRDGPSLAMLQLPDGRILRIEQLGKGEMWGNADDNDALVEKIAALTAVRHNRPAQEKAVPVAWIRREEIAHLAKHNGIACVPAWNCASGNDRVPLFTEPPAERVKVPAGKVLIDREALEIIAISLPLKHDTMPYAMEALGFARDEAKRALSAAPEADHE